MNNFLFLGGDLRFIYAAEKLNKRFDCFIYGQENTCLTTPIKTPMLREITKCRYIVLGLPSSRDGITLDAPNTDKRITPDIILDGIEEGGVVFAGKPFPLLEKICKDNNIRLIDYFAREELAVMNAVPTAEGALELIMKESNYTVYGMNILITGFGRISKVLVKILIGLGAKVTVAARKFADLSWAEILGCRVIPTWDMKRFLSDFDCILNTVPTVIFGKSEISSIKKGVNFIDLASEMGINKEKALEHGIKVIHALSLPGKVAPASSGEIIADTIINIISENQGTEREAIDGK